METNAAPRDFASLGLRAATTAALTAVLALLCFAGPAEAAKKRHRLVGRDGKIHACYRVKGKPKGVVRVVRGRRHRCRRGERRMAWRVRAPRGEAGAPGAEGTAGATGTSGSSSSSSSADVAGLETQVADLSLKLEALEGVLSGITNNDLTGALATLQGVTNQGLLDAIDAAPLVATICDQTSLLTEQTSLLGDEFESLVTTLTGTVLGAIFGGIEVPAALDPFSCTS